MSTDNRDDRVEEILRDTLSSQAELTNPSGDGLTRIQHRVAARRAWLRWLRPAVAAGCAVLVVAGGVGVYTAVHKDGTGATVTPGGGPGGSPTAYFYGVKDGRVAKFASDTGAALSYLTDAQPGGGVVAVQHVGDNVYFLTGTGSCSTDLESVPTTGGAPSAVAGAASGFAITSFAVSQQADKVALAETSCSNDGRGKLVFLDMTTRNSLSIGFPSAPPVLEAGPAWEPDGVHVDAFVRTGTMGYLARYDSTNDTNATPSTNACSGYDVNSGLPTAVAVDADGTVWFATQTGRSMQVVSCLSGQPTTAFTVRGSDTPQSLAVTADGSAVLLTDVHGKAWRWDGGEAVELSPSQPLTSVTW